MMRDKINQLLGPVKSVNVELAMPDQDYHADTHYLSSSVVKEYLYDPTLAVQRRVLKTVPPKEFVSVTQSAMRIGRAAHAYGLEGEPAFKSSFGHFPGRRTGKDWMDYLVENKHLEEDNILNIKEYDKAVELGKVTQKAFAGLVETLNKAGFVVFKTFPEISFFVEFERFKLKVRPDMLLLIKNKETGNIFFIILDLKTTSSSVTDNKALARTMETLNYPLSAAMYTIVVQKSLEDETTKSFLELTGDHAVPAGPMYGSFGILWASRDTLSCALEPDVYKTEHSGEENTWAYLGEVGFAAGLSRYLDELRGLRQLAMQAVKKEDVGPKYFQIQTSPSPWTRKEMEEKALKVDSYLKAPETAKEVSEVDVAMIMRMRFNRPKVSIKNRKVETPKVSVKKKEEEASADTPPPPVPTEKLTSQQISTLSRKELIAHPAVVALFPNQNAWKGKNINTVRSTIRKALFPPKPRGDKK